ncbi:MAG TPA: ABC transporter ATP-binding protein [Vicinamibacteria bacterium]|nr:ABC transporter ATP-binding protein [Vicinamibacteria bacterium]
MILEAQGLAFSYAETPVVKDVSLALPRGSFAGLIGPNGCGKSTLLRLLSGVLKPARGEVRLEGRSLAEIPPRQRAKQIAYVPQQQRGVFPFTALEVVLTGRSPYTSRFRFENEADRLIALEALMEVGAEHLAARPVTELSGGEQQMISVARALAQQSTILLLDEPAASLDLKHRAKLLSALKRLRAERSLTALVVTHDLQMLDETFDLLFALSEGRLVAEGAPRDVLSEKRLAAIYDDPHVRTREVAGRTFVWSEW